MSTAAKKVRAVGDAAVSDWLSEAIERGKQSAFAIVADIGPAEAERLLHANPGNRHLTLNALARIVRDLDNGRWQFNGESIVVADTGELNDGQHRLQAVLNTRKPIRSVIAFGVPRESRETLDTGKARDLADWVSLHGINYATTVAAACRVVMAYERSNGENLGSYGGSGSPSVAEALERAVTDKGLHEAAAHAQSLTHTQRLVPGSMVAACYYLLDRAAKDGPWFVDRVCIGDSLERESPAYETRRALMMTQTKRRADLGAMLLWGWHFHLTKKRPIKIEARFPLPALTIETRPET